MIKGPRYSAMLLAILMLTVVFHIDPAPAAQDRPCRVFFLHSYQSGHVCGQPQHDGVLKALREAGFEEGGNLEIRPYFMDTKKKNNTPELIEKEAAAALQDIRNFEPDVLVTLDDNAFRTVALRMGDSPIPVVFSGLNGQPEDYNRDRPFMVSRERPGKNITGVYEKLHIVDAVSVQANLFPGLKKIRFISDNSPTGQAITKQIQIETSGEELPCSWDIKVVQTWEEYQDEIFHINKTPEIGAIYPAALLLRDKEGKTYTAPDIFAWTVKHSQKCEIAINYGFTRMGLFGGAAVDFFAMGEQAGRMVAKILTGASPGDIPIEEAQRYALVFNLKRATQLGIEIPPDVLLAADEVIRAEP